ncbi:MAG: tetratricopeptide repeat protein [Syntrophaceae bacterium]|nr:tetratricopeptide repeat protein [Syntrophaceae bacterium]
MTTLPQRRQIRIFISSTFDDMAEERDELAKFVFPRMRKLCNERGISWASVDLRWGIPEEDVRKGAVLSVCLDEIDRCRPYFIGILGERYGTLLKDVGSECPDHVWIEGAGGVSITEAEILHGVLNNPEMADNAFFYFRDPAYINSLPSETQERFREAPGTLASQKLADLKTRIRHSGFKLVDGYADPRAFGRMVERDLLSLLDQLFQQVDTQDPNAQVKAEHEAFASILSEIHIGRRAEIEYLDGHMTGSAPPLLFMGPAGIGKSALLARWALGRPQCNITGELMVMHFVGATIDSTDWCVMVKRIMREVSAYFKITRELPNEPDALRAAFFSFLDIAALRGRIVLLIDGIDALDDKEGALDLAWLPTSLPENIRIVLTAASGRPLQAAKERNWLTIELSPLTIPERRQFVIEYLAARRKKLADGIVDIIAQAQQCANPRFLLSLLTELLVVGKHRELSKQVLEYLSVQSISELFYKILNRYEADYSRDRKYLARDALCLLACSRYGLTEPELLDLLGESNNPLPNAYWAPLYLALEGEVVNRSGLISLSSDSFKDAVCKLWLPCAETEMEYRKEITTYFRLRGTDNRAVAEVPWQLMKLSCWDDLVEILQNPDFLKLAWDTCRLDIQRYWVEVEANTGIKIRSAYDHVLTHPADNLVISWPVLELLSVSGYLHEALVLCQFLGEHAQEQNDGANFIVTTENKAMLLSELGQFEEALAVHLGLERTFREKGARNLVAGQLNHRGCILRKQGKHQEALAVHREQELMAQEDGSSQLLTEALSNQVAALVAMCKYQEARSIIPRAITEAKAAGDLEAVNIIYSHEGVMLIKEGKHEESLPFLAKDEAFCRKTGDRRRLIITLGNKAMVFAKLDRFEEASMCFDEALSLEEAAGYTTIIPSTLINQGLFFNQMQKYQAAIECFARAERLSRELGLFEELQAALANQATSLHREGKLAESLKLREEEIDFCRKHGFANDFVKALFTCSELLYDLRRYDDAQKLAREAYQEANLRGMEEIACSLRKRWLFDIA